MRERPIDFDLIDLEAQQLASLAAVFANTMEYGKLPAADMGAAMRLFEDCLERHAANIKTVMKAHMKPAQE